MPSTVTLLRNFLSLHPDLEKFGTQKGFGKLIGKSDPFVRSLEKSKAIDSKIGNLVESRIGAKAAWVMKGDTESDVIPAAAGGVLTHDMVIHLIEAQTRRNVQAAAEILSDDPAGELIDKLLGLLRAPLIRQLQEGDGTLLGKLAGLAFQAHSPQEETAREEPSGG